MADQVEQLTSALAGRYELREALGRGGMASVYLARDVRHDRLVAIKVLHPELGAALGNERFLREIRIISSLQHPHILPLHDSGTAGDLLFYVMPYVEGESLRHRLSREGELPVADAVRILGQVADALAAAHARGLVHRDIKPDNVLLSGRHALVADFGVARAVLEAGSAEALTTAGVALGTPGYMAPEQATAPLETDHRADIYAFGALAFELLTGRAPFEGRNVSEVLAAHLTEAPPDLAARRPAVPQVLAALVMRCLEKRPADRWQSAEELRDALEGLRLPLEIGKGTEDSAPSGASERKWGRPAGLALGLAGAAVLAAVLLPRAPSGDGSDLEPARILVVPFEDHTGDDAFAALGDLASDQIAREIERELSGVVQVVPAAVVRERLRAGGSEAEEPLLFLARSFRAGTLVTGLFRLSDGGPRFESEIIDARTGDLLVTIEPVHGPREATSELVGSVADRVVSAVAVRVDPRYARRAGVRPPPSLAAFRESEAAYQEFARGREAEAADRWRRAHEMDTTYLNPLLHVLAMHVNRGLRGDSLEMRRAEALVRDLRERQDRLSPAERADLEWKAAAIAGDLEADYRWGEELFRLSGGGYALALSALLTNRPGRAVEALSATDFAGSWYEDWAPFWNVYATAYHRLDRLEEALGVIVRGRARLPESLELVGTEIEIRAAMGQAQAVSELLEHASTLPAGAGPSDAELASRASLEFRAHGYLAADRAPLRHALEGLVSLPPEEAGTFDRRFELGRVLYWSERWAEARPVFEELARKAPEDPELLGFLGTTLARLGDREEALAVSERLRGLDRPYLFGRHTAWRARIAVVLEDPAEAVRLLREAYGEGQDYGTWLHREAAFEGLRGYPPFDDLVRPRE